jgi:two-component system LytT family sensor kinase
MAGRDEPTFLSFPSLPTDHWQQLKALTRELSDNRPTNWVRRRWRWSMYFVGWTLIGLLFAVPIAVQAVAAKGQIPWSQICSELFRWYLWGLFTPLIYWQAQRFPLERGRLLPRMSINIGIGVAITLLYVVLELFLRQTLTGAFTVFQGGTFDASLFQSWPQLIYWGVEYHLLVYFAISAVVHAFHFYDKFRDRELKASRLEGQLAMARLEVLKMQLHPHFLFNTLNAISALMHRDVHAADKMITLLADLLRLSLDKDHRHVVPLVNELEFLDRYLAIEKIRFRDRLRVNMDVDSSCLNAQVPRLILQPLVENSVRHGIARRSAAGLVEISARRKGNRLELCVADDGPGLPEKGGWREGVGLANTRARLQQLYGDDHRFTLERAEAGGLLVRLALPFEENRSASEVHG